MASDANYGDAGGASSSSLGTPAVGGMAKMTRAVRRGTKRMREETKADEIRVGEPITCNSIG
jgi:hypothetical protein